MGAQGATGTQGVQGAIGAGPQGAQGFQGVAGSGGGGGFTSGATTPTSPSNGDEWFDTTTGILFKYINDGNSSQWIQPPAGPQGFQGVTGGITTGKSIAMAIVFGG